MNKNVFVNLVFFLIGVTGMVYYLLSEQQNDMVLGLASGFIGAGVVRLILSIKVLKNEEYKRDLHIKNNDERNKYIATKSRSESFGYSILIEAIITIVFIFKENQHIAQTIGLLICLQLIIYVATYFANNKKY